MNSFTSWSEIITASIQNLWIRLITILPSLVGAIIVLILGFFLASALGGITQRLVRATGIDKLMREHPATESLRASHINFIPSAAIGWLVKWFFILVTLIAVANSLGWSQINEFLYAIAFYIPNVLISIIILTAGLLIGRFVKHLIQTALQSSSLTTMQAGFLSSIAQAAIVIFAIMSSLVQLKVTPSLIQILFGGIVFSLSIAFGLAFGLGGREKAAQILSHPSWGKFRRSSDINTMAEK